MKMLKYVPRIQFQSKLNPVEVETNPIECGRRCLKSTDGSSCTSFFFLEPSGQCVISAASPGKLLLLLLLLWILLLLLCFGQCAMCYICRKPRRVVVVVVDVDVVVVVLWPMCYICPGGTCPIPATDSTCPREETIKVLMKESKCHSLVKWTLSIGQAIDNNTSNRGLVLIQVCCNAFCDKIINQSCCCCFVFDIAQSSSFLF